MAETPKWYVVHTYSGYENKDAQNIEKVVENQGFGDRIFEVRVPTEEVIEYKDGKERKVERKTYPGYVLVKMIQTPESWYVVRNIRGVTGFVGPASKPVPLTDAEVEALGVEKHSVEVGYQVGDLVNIIDGPLKDFQGTVIAVDLENGSVSVNISMFGRETPAEFELDQIALVK